MSRRCQLTGAEPSFGKAVSHSHRRTSRRWNPNIQNKRYWLPSENRMVTLQLSAKGMRTIDKIGIEAAVRDMRSRGEKI